jgi:ABC-type spermidine/putrescine transport system permease subunit II
MISSTTPTGFAGHLLQHFFCHQLSHLGISGVWIRRILKVDRRNRRVGVVSKDLCFIHIQMATVVDHITAVVLKKLSMKFRQVTTSAGFLSFHNPEIILENDLRQVVRID